MIREELLHPALTHFPIACLVLVCFTKVSYLFVTRKSKDLAQKLDFTSQFLLFVGAAMLLPSMFLGDMSLDIVKPQLDNIILAYQHEETAQICLGVFVLALALEVSLKFESIKNKYAGIIQIIILLTLFVGNFFLIKTSHLGSKLVYEQGAGVILKND